MTDSMKQAIREAAASSAMEGMPLSKEDIANGIAILEGRLTIDDVVRSVMEENEVDNGVLP